MDATTWRFFLSGEKAWEAMLADCRSARRSIDFEQYIFRDDGIGRRFMDVLVERAAAGVRVRFLVDAVGGFFLSRASVRRLMQHGVQVRFFKPIRRWVPHRLSSWFFRGHRKLLIVDGRAAQTGGIGIDDHMHDWRDTQVRVEGPLVAAISDSFERMWRSMDGDMFRFRRFPDNAATDNEFALQTTAPHLRQRFVRRSLLRAIRNARTCVYLTTPYFIPDIRFFVVVRRAARRGVDVRILLPSVSDRFWLDVASGSYFGMFFKAGVRIYQYVADKRILHAKTAVIDDNWSTVGSTNWDNMSLKLNYEANIVSVHRAFVQEVKAQFLNDLTSSREMRPEAWKRRPFYLKVLEAITWPIHGIL